MQSSVGDEDGRLDAHSPRKSSDSGNSAGARSDAPRGLCPTCWLRARARASPRTARPPRRLGGSAAAARACSRGGALDVQRGSRSVRPPRVSCERWCRRRAFSPSRRRCASALARWRSAAASRSRAACASTSRAAASLVSCRATSSSCAFASLAAALASAQRRFSSLHARSSADRRCASAAACSARRSSSAFDRSAASSCDCTACRRSLSASSARRW
eukprot:scaffold1357_cov36-Phaeocystis_antarctica.AAC.2